MSPIIKPRIVLEGLKCCLAEHDCLSCPYSKHPGKRCTQILYRDAEVVITAQSFSVMEMMKGFQD